MVIIFKTKKSIMDGGGGNKIRITKFFRQHFEVTKQATPSIQRGKSLLRKTYVLQKDSSLQNGLRIEKVVKNPQNVFIKGHEYFL